MILYAKPAAFLYGQISLVQIILFYLPMANDSFQSAWWKGWNECCWCPRAWQKNIILNTIQIYNYTHPDIPRIAPMELQTLFIVNGSCLLLAENNRYKLQLCLFGAAMPLLVDDSRKPVKLLQTAYQNVSPVHLELLTPEQQWSCKAYFFVYWISVFTWHCLLLLVEYSMWSPASSSTFCSCRKHYIAYFKGRLTI